MNTTLLWYDLRRLTPVWLFVTFVVLIVELCLPAPLNESPFQFLIATQLPVVFTTLLLSERSSNECFVLTRGMSRRRVFWNRWLLGFAAIAVASGLVWVLAKSGLRETLHTYTEWSAAGLYPAAAVFEPGTAWTLLKFGAVSHALLAFVLVTQRLNVTASGFSLAKRAVVVHEVVLFLLLALGPAALGTLSQRGDMPDWSIGPAWMALTVLSVLVTIVAFYSFRFVEVET